MLRRGVFILLEGIDRTGKTTQCTRLVDHLVKDKGMKVEHMRFPDRKTEIGSIIDQYLSSSKNLNDHTIHLLFSANRWELANKIRETLLSGTSIVMDRYAFSGVAYSAAKGLSLDWCKGPDRGLPAPDLVIFLDVDLETQAKRGEWGQERYEKTEFQKKVRETYNNLCDKNWVTVDAGGSLEEVEKLIREAAVPVAEQENNTTKGILELWPCEEKK